MRKKDTGVAGEGEGLTLSPADRSIVAANIGIAISDSKPAKSQRKSGLQGYAKKASGLKRGDVLEDGRDRQLKARHNLLSIENI
jgi:hypothetical protein